MNITTDEVKKKTLYRSLRRYSIKDIRERSPKKTDNSIARFFIQFTASVAAGCEAKRAAPISAVIYT